MTHTDASRLFSLLQLGGLHPPPAIVSAPKEAARVYASAFDRAGVAFPEAEAAVMAYVDEPDPGTYPKPWPDPGKLIARTPTAKRLALFGGDLDVAMAWAEFTRRRAALDRYQPERFRALFVDEDAHLEGALRFALEDTGGPNAWLNHAAADAPHLERRWKDAYRAARRGQAADPAVRRSLAATSHALIAEAK